MQSTDSWKYFFLSDGWNVGRVWSTDGPWNSVAWRRSPRIERTHLSIVQQTEILWLYRVESSIVTIEVRPDHPDSPATQGQSIGQVLLTRLMSADQALDRLSKAGATCEIQNPSQF